MLGGNDVLEVRELVVRQGDFELSGAFTADLGARIAIMGPSGEGKSTLLNALGGYIETSSGQILVGGQDVTHALPADRGMATLFQDSNLFPHLTLAQNVGLALEPGLRLSHSDQKTVAQALSDVGLDGYGDRYPAEISGGQQSRTALARVTLMARPWLLLDEPFAALGPALRGEMLDLLATLLDKTGAGLLMVTHAPEDARRIAKQTLVISQGRMRAPVDTTELLADPPQELRDYLGT